MNLLISGSNGFLGRALTSTAEAAGHRVIRLVRRPADAGPGRIVWHPSRGTIDAPALDGLDAVVHLAGENVSDGRWTRAKKKRIRDSRVIGTRRLAEILAALRVRPRAFLSASAVGFYGDRGAEVLTEKSASGNGFLARVCREWEEAARPAAAAGIRVVHLRFGMVLSRDGGALVKMITPFRWGLGGPLGSGRQYVSWIGLDDAVSAVMWALERESLSGPLNVTAPVPISNADFSRALAAALQRPMLLRVPAWALKMALGEMAEAALLSSTRVEPVRLRESGFTFRDPEIGPALKRILRSTETRAPESRKVNGVSRLIDR